MMWLGALVLTFDAFEIEILNELGLLSIRDYDLLRKAKEAHHHNGELQEVDRRWSMPGETS